MTLPLGQEIAGSIRAAWRIALRDPEAMRGFNLTVEGFWRSFYAAVLLAPPYALLFTLTYLELPLAERPAVGSYVSAKLLLYVAKWMAFPLAMIPVTKLVRLDSAYVPLIIACNWASVLQMALSLPLALLFATGALHGDMASAVLLALYVTLLFYSFLVVRTASNCDILTAGGIVVLDAVLSLLVNQSALRLFQG